MDPVIYLLLLIGINQNVIRNSGNRVKHCSHPNSMEIGQQSTFRNLSMLLSDVTCRMREHSKIEQEG
jgi:hypothetical protein